MTIRCQGSAKHLWVVLSLSSVYLQILYVRGKNTLGQVPELVRDRVGMCTQVSWHGGPSGAQSSLLLGRLVCCSSHRLKWHLPFYIKGFVGWGLEHLPSTTLLGTMLQDEGNLNVCLSPLMRKAGKKQGVLILVRAS